MQSLNKLGNTLYRVTKAPNNESNPDNESKYDSQASEAIFSLNRIPYLIGFSCYLWHWSVKGAKKSQLAAFHPYHSGKIEPRIILLGLGKTRKTNSETSLSVRRVLPSVIMFAHDLVPHSRTLSGTFALNTYKYLNYRHR